jgi:hypothetical protein
MYDETKPQEAEASQHRAMLVVTITKPQKAEASQHRAILVVNMMEAQ